MYPEVKKLIEEMTGRRYGMLRVLGASPDRILPSGKKESMCLCECDCGKIKAIRVASLKNGNTKSCGCYRNKCSSERMHARATHGLGGTKIYGVWKCMIDRCQNPNNKSYKNYGGKGVDVCSEWQDVNVFVEWALMSGYKDGLTLERVNNNQGYYPDNCIWADRYVQNNHTSRNHLLTYMGRTQTMAQWSRELGLSYSAIKTRINRYGWPTEVALATPVR